ncbi:MAG: ADP-heptose:LPS heptosyltransferase [Crocinitomix sp.]|jgi:ADP-heptose:LPS heptosyltransferase
MGHSTLIFADRLLKPFYFLLKWIKCIWPKKAFLTDQIYVIKFFGLGSLTRIAYVIENTGVDKNKVTIITLKSNQSIIEHLKINAIYIRSSNPFYFAADYFKAMFHVWKKKRVHVFDMERSSNFSGIFRILLAIRKPSTGLFFKAENKMLGNQFFVTLVNKTAVASIAEMFGQKEFQLRDVAPISAQSNEVLINVNAGAYLPQRMFPLSKFADLVVQLHAEYANWTFVLTGAKTELGRVGQFINLLEKGGVDKAKIRNLAGQQNLNDFLTTIKDVDLVITNDSGPIHFANYVGAKTVGIWGPTSAEMVGYSNSNTMLNLIPDEACSPCFINPKSKVAKVCGGQLTCFHNYAIDNMVTKIKEFVAASPKNGIIDSE